MYRLWIHYAAIVVELFGTILGSLDLVRIDVLAREAGYASAGNPHPEFQSWIWNNGLIGSGLLLFGILLSAVALALEHREHIISRRRLGPDTQIVATPVNTTVNTPKNNDASLVDAVRLRP
jgi:hypothetical protein